MKYDYFVGGRWRSHEQVRHVLESIRATGKTAYCFIDNEYDSDGIKFEKSPEDIEGLMKNIETIDDWQTNPTFREIFENDMDGIRQAEETIIIFPAGLSAHMELGAAYGMGKKCYGIGKPEKHETLYLMFDEIFPTIEDFVAAKIGVKA